MKPSWLRRACQAFTHCQSLIDPLSNSRLHFQLRRSQETTCISPSNLVLSGQSSKQRHMALINTRLDCWPNSGMLLTQLPLFSFLPCFECNWRHQLPAKSFSILPLVRTNTVYTLVAQLWPRSHTALERERLLSSTVPQQKTPSLLRNALFLYCCHWMPAFPSSTSGDETMTRAVYAALLSAEVVIVTSGQGFWVHILTHEESWV